MSISLTSKSHVLPFSFEGQLLLKYPFLSKEKGAGDEVEREEYRTRINDF